MSNVVSELKLMAVIVGVVGTVWQVAQWSYAQERPEAPEPAARGRVVKIEPRSQDRYVGIELDR